MHSINDIDFGRSFVRFSTTRVNHTPRLNLAASCTFAREGQSPLTYHLSVACIAENMYRHEGHIQEPVAEFNLVQLPRTEFMLLRRHADALHDVRSSHTYGQTMPTHDGQGAKVVELDVHVSRFQNATPIQTYEQFREALLGNICINGRTSWLDTDNQTRVILDYPVNTGNVRHDQPHWQVDAGPILLPAHPHEEGKLRIERFEMAFIVYNRWDQAEFAIRAPAPVGTGGQSMFYHQLRAMQVENQLFACPG